MKFCNQCGTENTSNAKFCQECGHSLQNRFAARAGTPSQSSTVTAGHDAGASPLLNLGHCVSHARSRLKELKQPIPPASSEAIAPLMGRLQTIAPNDSTARIELIEALGRTRDPVALRALLLVAGAGSKHVRRAVAVALSGINHTLSAYILLPMLEDQSSRVRNSAIQALIYINQPYTAESIISACLSNRELKRIAFDTVRRLREIQRDSFIYRLLQVNPAGSATVSELLREFNAVAASSPSAKPSTSEYRPSPSSTSPMENSGSNPRKSAPSDVAADVQHSSVSNSAYSNSSPISRPKLELVQQFAEPPLEQEREQAFANGQASTEHFAASTKSGDSHRAISDAAVRHHKSSDTGDRENAVRSMNPMPGEAEGSRASLAGADRSAIEKDFRDIPPARSSTKSDDFVSHGIDVSSLDDLAVSRLMSELVPGTPGIRSSDSVADFRFFESVSSNLNDSRGDWQSPENSVFDYDPMPEAGFSDTQSFSTQNTNHSEFAFAKGSGSSAFGRAPQIIGTGSSGSWNVQPPMPHHGNALPTPRPMNALASEHSRSGSHVFHPPQNSPSPPGWPQPTQDQTAVSMYPAQAFHRGMQPPFNGFRPQHFSPMPPHSTMPPSAFQMPQLPAPAYPPIVSDPSIPLMSRSAEIPTAGHPNPMASSAFRSVSQPPVESSTPLSEDVLLNGGTMLEIPMLPAAGSVMATTDAQSTAPIELTVSTTVRVGDTEQAAKKAQGERNLERLRQARDHAFRILLENPESISGTAPRLISKKITALLTTPAGDQAKIKQQLVALGKTASPHVLETLASFCHKPVKEIRISCAEALGLVTHQGAVVQLLKFLGDKSGTVIETALKSMISQQNKTIYPVILAAGLVNSSLRTILSSSIESVAEEFKPAWEQQLLSNLKLADPDLVAFSLQLLVKLTGATHVDSFISFAQNSEPVIRAAAIESLFRTGAKKGIGTINEALTDPDPLVRSQAASAIGTIYSPRSIELLGKLLQDSNLSVRRSAAQSAAKIEETDLGDAIVASLNVESDPVVIEHLLEALNKNGGKNAYSLLVQFVEGSDTDLREIALKALRKLKLQESVPVFVRLLDDKQAHIRKQAIEQLALLKFDGAIPRLKQLLKTDTDEHVRGAAARALGDLQDRNSLDLLEEALEDHAVVRFQAVLALGKIGNSAAGPSLLALLKDLQPEIRYQAVRALGQLKIEGTEVHLEPLLHDSEVMVRRGVEQSLQEFGMSPSQIRSMRFQRSFSKAILAISPSYIFAALPGKTGSAVAVITMVLLAGSVWVMSNFGSIVSGSSSLPVLRVENVRMSADADLAAVWRKESVVDIVIASTGALKSRIQVPLDTREIILESKGGVLVLSGKSLLRLRPEDQYEPSSAMRKELTSAPLAVSFHQKENLCCLFMPEGSNTRLELLNAETLESSASYDIKAKFDGRCILSPDRKMALCISPRRELFVSDLASGEVFNLDLETLISGGDIGTPMAVQFSQDMQYVCFCTTTNLFIFSVNNMTLKKQIQEERGFFAVTSADDGRIRAVSSRGKIVEVSADLSSVSETEMEDYFDIVDVDPAGNQFIFADSETRDASVFDIQQNKVIATIVGE